ncbi:MAG: ChaN family lipoprotein [Candidatus Aminicenantales bacterium]
MFLRRTGFFPALLAAAFILSRIGTVCGQDTGEKSLLLKIGDKRFKDKTLEVKSGEIHSASEGRSIPFAKMIRELNACPFVYIGETHDSLPMHDIQLRVIQALYEVDRNIAVGLEMFPASVQNVLNKWSLGILTEDEFLREAGWYVHWNFNFGFYRDIFAFVRENKIPLYALNAPREIISKIRMSGWEALREDEKKIVPEPTLSHEEHRLLIRTIFESTELPPQMKGEGLDMMFEGLYRSQSAWDEVMAHNVLEAAGKERRKIIVLAGSGHLLYNLGINRRTFEKNLQPFKTIIVVPIPRTTKSLQVARSLGDFIWGIAEEERPAFPSVGLNFKKYKDLENLVIERKPINGSAKCADFDKGDVILSVDGKTFSDVNELRMYLAQFIWEGEATFRLLRSGQEKEVILKFKHCE